MMSSEFSLRQSAKSRLKDLFDAKAANIQNQLRRQMSKTVPLTAQKESTNGRSSQSSDHRGIKSAPTNDKAIDMLKQSPDSSEDNLADQDDLLVLEHPANNDDLEDDIDDNLSVRS